MLPEKVHSPGGCSGIVSSGLRLGLLTTLVGALTLLLPTGGCVDIPDPSMPACVDAGASVTYQGSIRPILETQCVGCHQEGSVGPFPLDQWSDVAFLAPLIVRAVEEGRMPPAQADPACRQSAHGRFLSDAQRALFTAWREAGYPVGHVCEYVPPALESELPDLGPPDLVLTVDQPIVPSPAAFDDYRAVHLSYVFEETTYVVASQLIPTDRSILHHGTIVLRPGAGSGGSPDTVPALGGLLPGIGISRMPPDSAMIVPPGSTLLLDLHYHVPPLAPGEPEPSDTPEVRLWTLPAGETPPLVIENLVSTAIGFSIDEGDGEASVTQVMTLPDDPSEIVGLLPHMHFLGSGMRVEIIRSDESRACAIDVPNYSFDWQLIHYLEPSAYLGIGAGDSVEVTCRYDNSQANQPIVDGEQIIAGDVFEGPGSLDEMCQILMIRMRPFELVSP